MTTGPVPADLGAPSFPPEPFWLSTDDWHTAGEPFRIVPELPDVLGMPAGTVAERRRAIMAVKDHPVDVLRRALCHEPRGHADMYGGFIVPPNDPGAQFGVLFWHKDGFSTACGHGTIALGAWALASGRATPDPATGIADVVIDVPSGRVTARVHTAKGKAAGAKRIVTHIDFVNVPSFQLAEDVPLSLPLGGADVAVKADLAWGGALYAFVDVGDFGAGAGGAAAIPHVEPANHDAFVALGRAARAQLHAAEHDGHGVYGICFYETVPAETDAETAAFRNVVVFADGQIDRSPCGSGTAARCGGLVARGELRAGAGLASEGAGANRLIHSSIIDTVFTATAVPVDGIVAAAAAAAGFPAVIPTITGMAHLTGRHSFYFDQADPTFPGFLFR